MTGLLAASDGRLWVATSRGGLAVIEHGSLSFPVTDQRLPRILIAQLAEDSDGNVWLATIASGVRKLVRHGFSTFRAEDGVALPFAKPFTLSQTILYAVRIAFIHRHSGSQPDTA